MKKQPITGNIITVSMSMGSIHTIVFLSRIIPERNFDKRIAEMKETYQIAAQFDYSDNK